jgi:hypothetical protein
MTTPTLVTRWSDRLAMDVALLLEQSGETIAEVLHRNSLTTDQFLEINKDPLFHGKVTHLRDYITEHGLTFRLKARAQAEDLLTTSWWDIHAVDVSPAVKADLIKSTVKWGGLEPKQDTSTNGASGGVSIQINLEGQLHDSGAAARVIEHTD